MTSALLESFLAAIQASVSVLLVIFYGGLAAKLKILTSDNTKSISKICVRMFLPALLFTQIGSELHTGSAGRYVAILVWALICHLISFGLGVFAHLALGMPDWVTVALMFNNTTSYPLLLIEALNETGILSALIGADESSKDAVERAKSYFLVFATVSSCLTFAVGPRLIDAEHAPEEEEDDDTASSHDNEATSLLPSESARGRRSAFFPSTRRFLGEDINKPSVTRRLAVLSKQRWRQLSPRTQWWLRFAADFFNAPLIGAVLGAIVGLTPPLQRAFFNKSQDGGFLAAWLTASLKTVGRVFVPLPVVIAGVTLYASMTTKKDDGDKQSTNLSWTTVATVMLVRFVLWSGISIGAIYLVASRTQILANDPILWFAMMLMPTGAPAMKLIALVQVNNGGDEEEASIAKLLTISYLISPILSITVVGSLMVSEKIM